MIYHSTESRSDLWLIFAWVTSSTINLFGTPCNSLCQWCEFFKGRYTRGSLLLQPAPWEKLPRLHDRFLAKKYVAQHNFCSQVLLPHIKLVWYERASSLVCTEICLPRRDVSPVGQSNCLNWPQSCPSCVLVGVLPGRSVFKEQAPSCEPAPTSNSYLRTEVVRRDPRLIVLSREDLKV